MQIDILCYNHDLIQSRCSKWKVYNMHIVLSSCSTTAQETHFFRKGRMNEGRVNEGRMNEAD